VDRAFTRNVNRAECASVAILVIALSLGCRAGQFRLSNLPQTPSTPAEVVAGASHSFPDNSVDIVPASETDSEWVRPSLVQPVAFNQVVSDNTTLPVPVEVSGQSLALEPLVADVLARNPDIRSATAAWRAAAARYPQVISLDDPMFGYMLGPDSWGSDDVKSAYTLEASQKVPWPGKRQLRGSIARAEANAAYHDAEEQRLQIAEATRLAYYEYFLAHRQLAVLNESTLLLQSFREIALRKFESAEAEQQDVLLADVELAQLERQRLTLGRAEHVARARINTLLLVAPESPLPPPPVDLPLQDSLPPSQELLDRSLSQRPELAAQAARIRRERYATALAHKEFYPDLEFVARYDAFWQEEPLRPMVGMNVNVPIYKEKRYAAVREASARGAQQQATLEAQANEISFQVEQAYQRVQESGETVKVYQQRILPAASHSLEAAQASYTAGRLDFLRLIESQRQLLSLKDGYYDAVAEYHSRLAELDRQTGVLPTPEP